MKGGGRGAGARRNEQTSCDGPRAEAKPRLIGPPVGGFPRSSSVHRLRSGYSHGGTAGSSTCGVGQPHSSDPYRPRIPDFVAAQQRWVPQYPRTHGPGPAPVRWAPSQTSMAREVRRRRDPAAAAHTGPRRGPARLGHGDRRWDIPGDRRRRSARDRDRAARQAGARRPRHEPGHEARAPVSKGAARDRHAPRGEARARRGRRRLDPRRSRPSRSLRRDS